MVHPRQRNKEGRGESPKLLNLLPLWARIALKVTIFLSRFRRYSVTFQGKTFWVITDKPFPKEIHTDDTVVENEQAKPGQIRKARLICDGTPPRVKCHWTFEIQGKP